MLWSISGRDRRKRNLSSFWTPPGRGDSFCVDQIRRLYPSLGGRQAAPKGRLSGYGVGQRSFGLVSANIPFSLCSQTQA